MFLKNKNNIFKIRRSKVTDYAALIFYVIHVKIGLSHRIHDIQLYSEKQFKDIKIL